jgi:hypothetical protein
MLVRLAMDGTGLMVFLHHAFTGWVLAPLLALHVAVGMIAGLLYFRALRRATDLFAGGGSAAGALLMGGGRFAALGVLLFLSALEGAWPLLCMAAGVMCARFAMLRAPADIAA